LLVLVVCLPLADPGKREKSAATAIRTMRACRRTVNPYRGKNTEMSMFVGIDGPQERETDL